MNSKLQKQVQQQKKIIDYLQKKFKETTGNQVQVPQTWQQFLDIPSQDAPIMPMQNQITKCYDVQKVKSQLTFNEAVANLNLPQRLLQQFPKKGAKKRANLSTSFQPTNPYHMVQIINLSGYQFRKFSKARLKQFLECIVDMRCLKSLILQQNGIGDAHLQQIQQLFTNKKITRIDLSNNKIQKASALLISKLLNANPNHIQWLDLSRNPFTRQPSVVSSLLGAFKSMTKIFHLGIDIQQPVNTTMKIGGSDHKQLINRVIKLLNSNKPPITSLSLVDTKLSNSNIKQLQQVLQSKDCTLNCLNLQYCFLDWSQIQDLASSLNFNKSLLKLNVSKNGLGSYSGIILAKILRENIYLIQVIASQNLMGDQFVIQLAQTLQINSTLIVFDIGGNPIGQDGSAALIRALTQKNYALQSLGNISKNLQMGIINIQKIKKLLKGNCISLQYKKAQVRDLMIQSQPLAFQEHDKIISDIYQAQYNDYILLKPIVFTNPLQEDPFAFRLWNI